MRIETKAFSDVRFKLLGRRIQDPPPEAVGIGVMALIWEQATQLGTQTLSQEMCLGLVGDIEPVIAAGLAERVSDTEIRIKGTEGRIEWLQNLRENAAKGGAARAKQMATRKASQKAAHLGTPTVTATVTTTSNNPPSPPGGEPPKPRRRRQPKKNPENLDAITAGIAEAFNKCLGRNLGVDGFRSSVRRCLLKGHTEKQMRAVMWWAGREWADDEDFRAKLTPTSLLKFQSSKGYRTFTEYLACASEAWRASEGGTPSWEK